MDRSPFLCRCFREEQRSVVEIECGKPDLAGHLCAGLLPMKTTRDHQMDDEEDGPVEFPHDLLSDSSQSPHNLAFDSRGRGVDGPQDKRAEEADPVQSAFDDTRAERFEIQDDVGKLGHGGRAQDGAGEWWSNSAISRSRPSSSGGKRIPRKRNQCSTWTAVSSVRRVRSGPSVSTSSILAFVKNSALTPKSGYLASASYGNRLRKSLSPLT